MSVDKLKLMQIQQALADASYYKGKIDGLWGSVSQAALDLVIYDAKQRKPVEQMRALRLTNEEIALVAQANNLLPSRLFALRDVESLGGFFADVRKDILDLDGPGGFLDGPDLPKILFEAHWFSRLTKGIYNNTHPNISSPKWNRALYKGGQLEYARLWEAMKLNEDAALQSASWGMFQIMGFNYFVCGYQTVQAFVEAMKVSEANHLKACIAFCSANGLLDPLRKGQWKVFAKGYNGPEFAVHKYDTKLEAADKKYQQQNWR